MEHLKNAHFVAKIRSCVGKMNEGPNQPSVCYTIFKMGEFSSRESLDCGSMRQERGLQSVMLRFKKLLKISVLARNIPSYD